MFDTTRQPLAVGA